MYPLSIYLVLIGCFMSINCHNSDDNNKSDIVTSDLKEAFRGLMENAQKLMPQSSTPLSYVLVPALTLAGIMPWIVPGIRIAAGLVQFINQAAFMAGLTTLVRSYIFDHRPDEHVVYINHGYGAHGHTKHHQELNRRRIGFQ